jgi:hypothetical protein
MNSIRSIINGNATEEQILEEVTERFGGPVDVNERDAEGRTALMDAVRHGYVSVVELLVNKGAIIDAKDKDGKTAFDIMKNLEQEGQYDNDDFIDIEAIFIKRLRYLQKRFNRTRTRINPKTRIPTRKPRPSRKKTAGYKSGTSGFSATKGSLKRPVGKRSFP